MLTVAEAITVLERAGYRIERETCAFLADKQLYVQTKQFEHVLTVTIENGMVNTKTVTDLVEYAGR